MNIQAAAARSLGAGSHARRRWVPAPGDDASLPWRVTRSSEPPLSPPSVEEPSDRAPPLELRPGTLIAERFELERKIAQGGMGAVWQAHDRRLSKRVAVKVMLDHEDDSDVGMKRFVREARAVGASESEHIVDVYDVGFIVGDRQPYMVMEYLEGEPLHRYSKRRGAMDVAEAVDLVLQACVGIAQAHACGVVHRDLKPSNLFLTRRSDGRKLLKVLDFGIAKPIKRLKEGEDAQSLTATGTMLGTPGYLAPEQLKSRGDADPRTDVWAMGQILHKLLTRVSAFPATTLPEYVAMIVTEAPMPLRATRADLPPQLEQVVRRCLQRKVARRYQNVAELARALAPFASAEGTKRVTRIEEVLWSASGGAGMDEPAIPALPAGAPTAVLSALTGTGATETAATETATTETATTESDTVASENEATEAATPQTRLLTAQTRQGSDSRAAATLIAKPHVAEAAPAEAAPAESVAAVALAPDTTAGLESMPPPAETGSVLTARRALIAAVAIAATATVAWGLPSWTVLSVRAAAALAAAGVASNAVFPSVVTEPARTAAAAPSADAGRGDATNLNTNVTSATPASQSTTANPRSANPPPAPVTPQPASSVAEPPVVAPPAPTKSKHPFERTL